MAGADSLNLTLLDGFEVGAGGAPVVIRGTRSRQVLAFLALESNQIVSVDRLIDAIWGEAPPASARNSVQRFVSDLRRDLGPAAARIESIDAGYRLALGDNDWCDAVSLERMLPTARAALADGRPGDALSCVGSHTQRIAEPFASLDGAAFAALERERLSELLADCGQIEIEARLAQGDSEAAVASARPLLAQYPYRERVCISLATGLTQLGRANEGLRVLAAFRAQLGDDLGLDASPVIAQTELDILLHRDAEPVASHPRVSIVAAADAASDDESSTLIGRDHVVARAVGLLETRRVVTLAGAGGIGKTAVADAVRAAWRRQHGGEVRFVSFEEVAASGLAAAVGQVVGTSAAVGLDPLGEVVDRVCAEVDLLVLDNCEHIVADVADFVDELLAGSRRVRVLATSRSPLGRAYEQLVPIEPLDRAASRDLLHREVDRAGVDLGSLDGDSISALLDQVDGLPLAIELAGAGVRSVGATDLLSLWRNNELPTRQATERHRSVATAVRSTLRRLGERELDVLGLCSLFPADFSEEALTALAGGPAASSLQMLVGHSLLEVDSRESATRYRMLVPIRSEVRAATSPFDDGNRAAFTSYFAGLASRCLDQMKGTESAAGVALLRSELSGLGAAFDLAVADGRVSAMASIVECVGLANGMSPSVGAKSHLRIWGDRLRPHAMSAGSDIALQQAVRRALAWGLYGSNDGAWYQLWESEPLLDDVETQAMAAIARFSRGESAAAWDVLGNLDLRAAPDPYLRAMLCGVGAVIAFEVGVDGYGLRDAAVAAASERPSHGASFFADLARSTAAFVDGDVTACVTILETAVERLDGQGLVTLENMGLAGIAMTAGFILGVRDPSPLLIGLVDRYLDQHSLDPASVAMALDVTVLQLDRSGATEEAAELLGLLDQLGLSMAILRGPRASLEAKIATNTLWSQSRAAGFTRTPFAVLGTARSALVSAVEAARDLR